MNEAGLNAKWIRADMTHESCQEFTKKTLRHMLERLKDYQEQYGDLYNLEATPAESTSYRLAKHDVERYPDIITAAEPGGTPYYTNSSHLPVGYNRGHLRRARRAGRASDPLHLRHRLPRLPGREAARLAGRGLPCAQDRRELQAAVLHPQPDLLRLQEPRVSQRRAVHLPALRRERGGLQPHNRLLPPPSRTGTPARRRSTRSARPTTWRTATSTP